MIILDTNVISEITRADGNRSVFAWVESKFETDLFLCTPVVAEMAFGAQLFLLRTGSYRHLKVLETVVDSSYRGRILPMTLEASRLAGRFKAVREAAGRPVASADMYIAGIAAANKAALATRNVRDFEGLDLKLINPFEA